VYRFPLERATRIALSEVKRFLEQNNSIDKVIFVCFDRHTYEVYQRLAREILGV
jgi:O-acetyl-ADP-ribose deacetylase (regulator of RNase III)